MNKKALIEEAIEEVADDLLYYKRVNDPDLPNDAIEQMVANGEVTLDEIVQMFKRTMAQHLRVDEEVESYAE